MNRIRLGLLLLVLSCLGLSGQYREALAAAEVHRLNLAISMIPTQVTPREFNRFIDDFNRSSLDPLGIEGLKSIDYAWLFDVELRYFVKSNVAVSAGVGQLRKHSEREILPGILQDVQLRAEILSVPVHVGGSYYFQPYNQGDFQARAYVGGGFLNTVYNRARLQSVATGLEPPLASQANFKLVARRDSPGFYVEGGVHMFFASRYSVLLAALARSSKVRNAEGTLVQGGRVIQLGPILDIDTSGVGGRMSVAVGF